MLGDDHPFLDQVATDLEILCDHENAGDLMIFGWSPGDKPVSFVSESGAHGSVGTEETRGFALVPQELRAAIQRRNGGESFTRGQFLHDAAWEFVRGNFLGTAEASELAMDDTLPAQVRESASNGDPLLRPGPGSSIRVMTYNIHSCIGIDGKIRPNRVADVIAAAEADIVCLQEVDAGRARTNFGDQSALIANRLRMHCEFFPILVYGNQRYGLAILSRFPITLRRTDRFPPTKSRRPRETRGAMWAEIDSAGAHLQVINTHLGLQSSERHQQVTTLLEEDWLGEIATGDPIVVCGDLNAGPKSKVVTRLSQFLDCDDAVRTKRPPSPTFPSPFPLRQIDHILFNDRFVCRSFNRVRTPNAREASDHLPVVADLVPRLGSSHDADVPLERSETRLHAGSRDPGRGDP